MEYVDVTDELIWAELDEDKCPCQGNGWAFIEDWEECPLHFQGQLHPMSVDLLLDDPARLEEAKRVSNLNWKIDQAKEEVRQARVKLQLAQSSLSMLELELINKTPTRQMEIIKIQECYPTVQMKAVRPQ